MVFKKRGTVSIIVVGYVAQWKMHSILMVLVEQLPNLVATITIPIVIVMLLERLSLLVVMLMVMVIPIQVSEKMMVGM